MVSQLDILSTAPGADEQKPVFRGEWRERIAMSWSEWAKVPDNPIQRNTELHARRAKHLRMPSPMHRFVVMAELPDGKRFKVDGHTRGFLWERDEIPRPAAVSVDVFGCLDIETVELLYRHFDNPLASETAAEQLTGAIRLAGLELETTMLRRGRFGTGLKRAFLLATGYKSSASWHELPFVYAAVEMFADELVWLDTIAPIEKRFPAGLLTAVFITLRRAGEPGLDFWRAYSFDRGDKGGGTMDAVQALTEEVLGANRPTAPSLLRQPWHDQLFVRGVTAFEGYRAGQRYIKGLKSMNRITLRAYARGPKGELKSATTEFRRQKK